MRRRNLIAGIVLLALGAGYAYLTAHLPTRAIAGQTEPSFFPWVIVTCLFLLTAALLAQGLTPATDDRVPALPAVPPLKYAAGLAAFAIYLAALPWLGFLAANIPFFFVLMLLYGERRISWLVLGSVGVPTALYFLFREAFLIILPPGVLEGIIP